MIHHMRVIDQGLKAKRKLCLEITPALDALHYQCTLGMSPSVGIANISFFLMAFIKNNKHSDQRCIH